jgi:hypothetical protein
MYTAKIFLDEFIDKFSIDHYWKIKSSYCDKGTHYKCEKLSGEEITKIKKDKTTDHHCKIYVCHKIPLTQH